VVFTRPITASRPCTSSWPTGPARCQRVNNLADVLLGYEAVDGQHGRGGNMEPKCRRLLITPVAKLWVP